MDVCSEALDKTAPLKQTFVRANNSPLMNNYITGDNETNKVEEYILESMSDSNRVACNSQRNCCASLVRKAKNLITTILTIRK